jgi:DNA repair protein RadA/Sms
MAKTYPGMTITCFRCGEEFPQEKAQCLECGAWNIGAPATGDETRDDTVALVDAEGDGHTRIVTGPWDVCFGGGIPAPSVTLVGGKPGAGKSTLSIQLAAAFTLSKLTQWYESKGQIRSDEIPNTLYLSTEETAKNVQSRAIRLNLDIRALQRIRVLKDFNALSQTFRQRIVTHNARLLILDSLAGISGDDHREAIKLCHQLTACAVEFNMPIVIIDHATKDDDFAGLLALQHFVDITMTLIKCEVAETPDGKQYVTPSEDGDHTALTTRKSRFGPTPTTALFRVTEQGLVFVPERVNS